MEDYSAYTDLELVVLLKDKPEAGITVVYDRYWKLLLDSAYRRLKDEQDAQEIVQELFIGLYTRRHTLFLNSSLEAYLRNALKYRVLNHFRHKTTRERYAQIMATQPTYSESEVEMRIEEAELNYRLKLATEQLPPKCREVFVLSKIEHLSNAKIAAQLGISVSTVEKHISRGMELMRKHLGDYDSGLVTLAILISAYAGK